MTTVLGKFGSQRTDQSGRALVGSMPKRMSPMSTAEPSAVKLFQSCVKREKSAMMTAAGEPTAGRPGLCGVSAARV